MQLKYSLFGRTLILIIGSVCSNHTISTSLIFKFIYMTYFGWCVFCTNPNTKVSNICGPFSLIDKATNIAKKLKEEGNINVYILRLVYDKSIQIDE